MQFTVKDKHSGWSCEYTVDDQTGKTLLIACSRPGPIGPQRDVLGYQAEAGEENQAAEADRWDAA